MANYNKIVIKLVYNKCEWMMILIVALIIGMSVATITPDSKTCDASTSCENQPYLVCKDGYCQHKTVFPIEWLEFIGMIVLAVTIALCNASGIGGGGIIVTIGITMFMMSPKEAVANSNIVIFFGCVTRFVRRFNDKHPLKDATSIDYNIVTCQLPLLMLGTYIGVMLNEFLPDFLVFVLLFLTLLYLSYKGIIHAIEARKKENAEFKKKREAALANQSLNDKEPGSQSKFQEAKEKELFRPLIDSSHTHSNVNPNGSLRKSRTESRQSMAKGPEIEENTEGIDEEDKKALVGVRRSTYKKEELQNKVLNDLIEGEKRHFRLRNIIVVTIPVLSILIINFLRGSKTMNSIVGIKRCDAMDYVLLAFQAILLIALTFVNVYLLKKEYNLKLENDYQFVKGDMIWDQKTVIKFAIFGIIGGFISGAVGLSGGILFTPLFLDFGIAPTVASSTSMYMAMFATGSSSVLFMFSGFIIYDFSFWLSAWSIFGTALGITIIGNAVKKSGRVSILVILLGFVITASCIAEGIFGTIDTIDQINKGESLFAFNDYC